MQYRKYINKINIGATIAIIVIGLSSCASNMRTPSSVETEDQKEAKFKEYSNDGREPSSLKGDFTWLNEVEDNFSKVAAATSDRAVASASKQEVLMKKKNWSFGFHPKANHFFVSVNGTSYKMVQTRINDGEKYAFAAEGQRENPLTFAVSRVEGRSVASGELCETEISYWDKSLKTYVTEQVQAKGKSCARLLSILKDYIP